MSRIRYEIGEDRVFILRGSKAVDQDLLAFMQRIGAKLKVWKTHRIYPATESMNMVTLLARDELLYRGLIKPC